VQKWPFWRHGGSKRIVALAGAGLGMWPSRDSQRADNPVVFKAMVLKVAVVGTGYFSQFHFDGWSRLGEVQLVAVCSLDPAGLVDAAARYLIPRQFADVGAMLDATSSDLLDVVTPPAAHLAVMEEAARRGVDVICQKPLGGDLATACAMVKIAEDAGITFIAHENFRFQPWYREARRLIDQGALGEVHNIGFRLRPGDGQGPRAYLERQPYFQEMPRFLIHETAIHMIDTFRFLLGEMSGVFARLRRLNPHIKGEDAGLVLFDFASGAAGVFDGNRLVDFVADDPRLTMGEMLLEGVGGTLRLDGFGRLWLKPHKGPEREHAYKWRNRGYGGDCVRALQRHVVAHLQGGAPLENTGSAYLRNLEIEQAIYRSAASGQWEAL
jgi:D-apiose dehydrogenase